MCKIKTGLLFIHFYLEQDEEKKSTAHFNNSNQKH
jgi:hypothetical protein